MESETNTISPRTIDGIEYITAHEASAYLGVVYGTIFNLVNSRQQYLKSEKIGSTLFITWESAQEEKIRRAGLQKQIENVQAEIAAKEVAA